MNKIKVCLIISILNLIFFSNNILNASSNFYIVAKVDNEIITNVDIAQEINYLIQLNNDLQKMNKKQLIKLAKDSLIREKIKKNELNKNINSLAVKEDVFQNIIKNYYKKLNLNSLEDFENYLQLYKVSLAEIKEKIRIEILWNQHVYYKYRNLLNINEEELKKKIKDKENKDSEIKKYLLSEILFSLENEENFEKKNNEIREKIQKNGFKTAANIYSISSTANFGGRIGLMNEKQIS